MSPIEARLRHTFDPVYDDQARVLILGTFPSVKSRENAFYYGHPQNRFWKLLAHLFEEPIPETMEEKTGLLLRNHIALWDVCGECNIMGSDDASIKDVTPNDIGSILRAADIQTIFTNGKTAQKFYDRLLRDTLQRPAICLPSTSPANCRVSFEELIKQWQIIREDRI